MSSDLTELGQEAIAAVSKDCALSWRQSHTWSVPAPVGHLTWTACHGSKNLACGCRSMNAGTKWMPDDIGF